MPGLRRALPIIALLLALPGCGRQTPQQAPTTATTTAAETDVALRPVQILTPTSHDRRMPSGASVKLTGTATAGELIAVFCSRSACSSSAITDQQGRWKTTVGLPINLRGRVRVTARYLATEDPDLKAAITLRVRKPARTTRPARRTTPESEPQNPQTTTSPAVAVPPPARTGSGAIRRAVVIGDSLADGTRTLLPGLLPGWSVSTNARIGRPLAEGMSILTATPRPSQPTAAVLSLFTNNEPPQIQALRQAVTASLRWAGTDGCSVWATIARPPVNGRSYAQVNAMLDAMAAQSARLRVIPWAQTVAAQPQLLAGDGVHATPAGYRIRARLLADALTSC